MTANKPPAQDELTRLRRKLDRERRAREEAESLLEEKSSLLFDANQKLEIEARRARSLIAAIESASDGIAITDTDGIFIFMNKAHADMFEYGVSDLLGKAWSVLYGAKELDRFDRQIMPAFAARGYWRGETTGVSKSGAHILQEIALTGLPDGGLICATRDITRRRENQIRARELEQRLVQAEQEAALFSVGNAVAHDFNNLIGAISGYAVLLQNGLETSSDLHNYADRIGQAADQAAGVIRSLELERSNDTTTLEKVDLCALVQTGLSIAEALRPPGILIDVDVPETARVYTNEVAVSRGLLNIVKNAFEAMKANGELRIKISNEPSLPFDQPIGYLNLGEPNNEYTSIIEVSDTGPGIDQEKLNGIFEPFFTTKTSFQGSGLGLLSLTALVETGTAFIEVLSQLGNGTLFRISFKPQASPEPLPVYRTQDYSGPKKHPHILIVEDEEMMREVIGSTLDALGYKFDLERDPLVALARLEDTDYKTDLLLTDMTMPGMQGDELATRAQRLRPHVPVIIYSGQAAYIKPNPRYAAILRKPIDADELNQAIRQALKTN